MSFGKVPFIILPYLLFFSFFVQAQNKKRAVNTVAVKKAWVDSVYNTLNETERIGQLFMVAAYSGGKDYNEAAITELVQQQMLGGLIFMQGTPEAQATQNNKYQQLSKVPLLIGMDAEWGLGMRLTGVKDLPRAMLTGATKDTLLAYRLGAAIAAQCRRMGVHINFGPVVDVNNNPDNPIINARSFGEDKYWVTAMGLAYMKGMQDNGVMACAKHFPGHGDTKTDSHHDMPLIGKSLQELDTLELYPFKTLINAGVKSVMVAHLDIPALETEPHIPTTLSRNTITNFLKNKLGFKGLVFTDALNMDGVAKYFQPGEVDLRAFMAGNDMLLFSQNVPTAIDKIKEALATGKLTEAELEQSVKKILAAKYDIGLNNWKPVDINYATYDVNKNTEAVRSDIAAAGVTFVRDGNHIVEKLLNKSLRTGYIGVNESGSSPLYEQISEAREINAQWLPKGSSAAAVSKVTSAMNQNTVNVVVVHNMKFYPSGGDYGLDQQQVSFLKQLEKRKDVIIVLMGNAYWLRNICAAPSLMVAYEDDTIMQTAVGNILLKQANAMGALPVTPCNGMTTEVKMVTAKAGTKSMQPGLKETFFVEDAGVVNPQALDKMNLFIQRAITEGAFPGCRIVAAKDGIVFVNKAYGYQTYDKEQKIELNTLYDVASVTKVLSTTIAIMRLYEEGKIDLDKTVSDYLSWTKGTDKAGLKIRDLLLHEAGLKSWIPFYKETLDETGNPKTEVYAQQQSDKYKVAVARNMYMRNDYVDTVWNRILNSPLENKGRYVYSDLDFYFLAAIAEQVTGKYIDEYVNEQFYKPMGLTRISFQPLKKFKISEIAPAERDIFFRKQVLQGYVDDEGAAMLGGVAGHAGIFASADDVAAIFYMLLNKGVYNNRRYLKAATVNYFTSYCSGISRRGLGFDKPDADKDNAVTTGNKCSGYTFGHQGFTGTCAWADPETGIVFVFLSNRTYPSRDNNKINKMDVRTVVQDYIYESLGYPVNNKRPELLRQQRVQR